MAGDGKRRSIRLGKVAQRVAEGIKYRVEVINSALIAKQAIDPDTARWLASIDDELHAKLAKVELCEGRNVALLGPFLDSYLAERTDVKPLTMKKYETTKRMLIEQYGRDRSLRAITPADADAWRAKLLGKGLGENTIRKYVAVTKLFFNAAKRKQLVEANPFADLKATIQKDTSRYHFVSRADAEKVLDACPDAEWRLIFALCRYAGLRCPSEVLALKWEHVLWQHDRIEVQSPKTEHHAGGESRMVPIFPELRPYLEDARELAAKDAAHVITRYRDSNSNLRTQLNRIIKRAGLKPWAKPFQNLRSTRETELAERFPLHVVCSWIGNSEPVASKHRKRSELHRILQRSDLEKPKNTMFPVVREAPK